VGESRVRSIKRQHPAYRDDIADLSTIRPLPGPDVDQIDPFIFLNHHGPQVYPARNHGLPFGPHPHRGFETVTFILEGELAHLDSGGGESIIREGGVQWMTAGSGLVHAEISPDSFKQKGGPLEILQLWVNLPSRFKMVPPNYVGLQKADIPEIVEDGGKVVVHLISGEWRGQKAPIQSLIDIHMVTLDLKAGGRVSIPVARDRNVFFYVVRGQVSVGGEAVGREAARPQHLIELNNDADSVDIDAASDAVILFGHAAPIGEPVIAHGPFVMNTREEIRQAMVDYQSGKFGGLPRM
jgi:redox-sensitive bicupin YhaK (pirin superfamily)